MLRLSQSNGSLFSLALLAFWGPALGCERSVDRSGGQVSPAAQQVELATDSQEGPRVTSATAVTNRPAPPVEQASVNAPPAADSVADSGASGGPAKLNPEKVEGASPTQPRDPAERTRRLMPERPLAEPPSRPRGLPGRANEITFDDLKFDLAKGDPFERSLITPRIEELLGKKVRLPGFILPTFSQTGIKEFIFVRDNQECCFGPGAALYDCVYVQMLPGKSASFSIKPVTVEGVLSIQERLGIDGKHTSIYQLDAESVR